MSAPARPASTIVLLRDGPAGLQTFMVVRHHEIDFASGALVFPGGRMEPADLELAAAVGDDDPALGLRIAAIREAFEECGVLFERAPGETGLVSAERARGLDRSIPFAELLARENLAPAVDRLVPFAHWITPAFLPKRFDTWNDAARLPILTPRSSHGERRPAASARIPRPGPQLRAERRIRQRGLADGTRSR